MATTTARQTVMRVYRIAATILKIADALGASKPNPLAGRLLLWSNRHLRDLRALSDSTHGIARFADAAAAR